MIVKNFKDSGKDEEFVTYTTTALHDENVLPVHGIQEVLLTSIHTFLFYVEGICIHFFSILLLIVQSSSFVWCTIRVI